MLKNTWSIGIGKCLEKDNGRSFYFSNLHPQAGVKYTALLFSPNTEFLGLTISTSELCSPILSNSCSLAPKALCPLEAKCC